MLSCLVYLCHTAALGKLRSFRYLRQTFAKIIENIRKIGTVKTSTTSISPKNIGKIGNVNFLQSRFSPENIGKIGILKSSTSISHENIEKIGTVKSSTTPIFSRKYRKNRNRKDFNSFDFSRKYRKGCCKYRNY